MSETIAAEQTGITQSMIRGEAWKFYLVLLLWPGYLFVIPRAYAQWGIFGLLLTVFPGVYLFTWVGYLMHECWHKYVPGLPNDWLYHVFAWMLLTDSQVYKLLHGHHHSDVNTWDDREFHPLGEIQSVGLRQWYHAAEIFGGVIFLTLASTWAIPRHPLYGPKYRPAWLGLSMLAWLVFLGGVGLAAAWVFGVTPAQIGIPWLVTFVVGSFVLHHSQLIEHGNLIVPGDWNQRNIKTRNLSSRTLGGRLFLFLTHGDSQEHVLHHTRTIIYSRPFPGKLALPEQATVITLRQYFGVLQDMLLGRPSQT